MSSSVDQIKEKLDIADIVASYIKLEKAGGNFKGKCPFHNEKTPSFFISPDRGTYYCFGCGAKGDIFTFVQEFEGLDFRGALKNLALRAGVELGHENVAERSEKDRLYSVLAQATFFFQKKLSENADAKNYLLGRGLTEESIKEWSIGYAPNAWQELHDFLLGKGFTKPELERVGLIKKSDKRPGEYYDVFRGRIVFPIFDVAGKVIAFSGRILVDDGKSPKYLNTSETILFNKSQTLYGLHKAKVDIRRKDYCVLVEGQMDLVMVHQAGFGNTIASSGTAFTAEHLGKLGRLSNRIVLAFDADGAGFTAANKSAQLALSLGMEVKIALLPKGTDPAELIKNDPDKWKSALQNTMHIIDFYMQSLLAQNSDAVKKDPRKLGKEIQSKVLPYVNQLPSSIERAHFVSKIAERAGIKEEAVWEDLKKTPAFTQNVHSTNVAGGVVNEALRTRQADPSFRKNSIEKKILGIKMWQESVSSPHIKSTELLQKLKDIVGEESVSKLLAELESTQSELIFEIESYYDNSDTLTAEIDELFMNLQEERLKEEFTRVMTELGIAEKSKDAEKVKELLEVCQELSKKITALPKKQ
ncbi:DNA primase [Candidatus Parcubacteria bacterium]|nr:DNA primase [Candidatus Parcubacteria bacterium]